MEDRTLVFRRIVGNEEILVTIYAEGEVDVAHRDEPGDTWGVPWEQVSDERTSR